MSDDLLPASPLRPTARRRRRHPRRRSRTRRRRHDRCRDPEAGPHRRRLDLNPVLLIGVAAVVLLVLSLFLTEDGVRLWSDLGVLWSLFALAMVLLTLLPSVRKLVNLSERQAWRSPPSPPVRSCSGG